MRKGNLFITLGLALGLGVGAFAGLKAGQEVKEVSAEGTISSVTLKGSFDGWSSGVAFTKQPNGDYKLSYALTSGDFFKIFVQGGADEWVGYNWGISESNIEYEFVGDAENDGNFKALSNFTLDFTVKSSFYTNYGSDVTIKLGETRTVQFVDTTGAVFAESENLTPESNQFSGLITTTTPNSKFRIKDTIGSTTNYYASKEDGVTAATEVSVDEKAYFNIESTGTYSVYFKRDSHKCWIALAATSDVAYMYATYFLNNVGCDSEYGLDAPSGWDSCATRYGTLSDDVKDFIYAADSHWEVNDDLYHMIQTYNWALNHNPHKASLEHFIVNSSDAPRSVPAASTVVAYDSSLTNSTNNVLIIIAIIAGAALLSIGGYLILRNRKED